jgi:RNA polymerase sigma factor for flagellar operon FliA
MNNAAPQLRNADLAKHMPLVHRIVAQFVRRLPRSVQREDLVSAGTMGLFNALRTSNHTCEEMFIAYARIRIRGSIVDELRRHDWSPRRRRAENKAPVTVSQPPPAAVTPVTVVGFDDLPPQALGTVEAGTPSIAPPCASAQLEQKTEWAILQKGVAELPERERAIIRMRYFEEMPSKDIAASLGLSEARVSQLHARATARLRAILAGEESAFDAAA